MARYYDKKRLKNREARFLELKKEQQANYYMLLNSVGTPEQEIYLKKERKLQAKELQMRKKFPPMHKFREAIDPCPINFQAHCQECTHYFREKAQGEKGCRGNRLMKCCSDEVGARLCPVVPKNFLVTATSWSIVLNNTETNYA